MIIPMLCVTIFVILVVWFLLPRVARLMIHTPTAISIFVCLSMVQLMAVFISMRCTLCGHFLQDRKSGSAGMPRPISYAVFCLKKKNKNHPIGTSAYRFLRYLVDDRLELAAFGGSFGGRTGTDGLVLRSVDAGVMRGLERTRVPT